MDRATLTGGRGTGEAAAVASIHRIDRQIGRLLRITYMERSRAEQFRLLDGWNRRLPGYKFALHPDESWHCEPRARAIDTPDWAVFGAVLIRNGWRRVNKDENWHWQFYPELDLHRNDTASGGSTPFEEDDMTPDQATQLLEAKNAAVNTETVVRQILAELQGKDGKPGLVQRVGEIHQAIYTKPDPANPDGTWPGISMVLGDVNETLERVEGLVRGLPSGGGAGVNPEVLAEKVAANIAKRLAE